MDPSEEVCFRLGRRFLQSSGRTSKRLLPAYSQQVASFWEHYTSCDENMQVPKNDTIHILFPAGYGSSNIVYRLTAVIVLIGDGQCNGKVVVSLFFCELAGCCQNGLGGGQVFRADAGNDPTALGGFFVNCQNIVPAGDNRHGYLSFLFIQLDHHFKGLAFSGLQELQSALLPHDISAVGRTVAGFQPKHVIMDTHHFPFVEHNYSFRQSSSVQVPTIVIYNRNLPRSNPSRRSSLKRPSTSLEPLFSYSATISTSTGFRSSVSHFT